MSRIFEALRRAQSMGPASKPPKDKGEGLPERRRSPRVMFDVSVYVYGHATAAEPFHEEAYTLNVNDTGAMLLLSAPVQEGQELLLTNPLTQKEQGCRIVFLGTRRSRTIEAGVAFPLANPAFWRFHKTIGR
jgi:hypothetical protein